MGMLSAPSFVGCANRHPYKLTTKLTPPRHIDFPTRKTLGVKTAHLPPKPSGRVTHRSLPAFLAVGSLAILVLFFSVAWVKDNAARDKEFKIERRGAILRESAAVQGRIEELNKHVAALEEKAVIQSEYAVDLRRSFTGNDGSAQEVLAEKLLIDRDRLLKQTKELQEKLLRLKYEYKDLDL
jgi:hypothetical protein